MALRMASRETFHLAFHLVFAACEIRALPALVGAFRTVLLVITCLRTAVSSGVLAACELVSMIRALAVSHDRTAHLYLSCEPNAL